MLPYLVLENRSLFEYIRFDAINCKICRYLSKTCLFSAAHQLDFESMPLYKPYTQMHDGLEPLFTPSSS